MLHRFSGKFLRPSMLASLSLILVFAAVGAPSPAVETWEELRFDTLGLTLHFPSSQLTVAESPSALVPVLLRSITPGALPTFNIVVEAGKYLLNRPASELDNALLGEYRLVGLGDARLLDSSIQDFPNYRAYTATIAFSQGGRSLTSLVAKFPGSRNSFTATFVDSSEHFAQSEKLAFALLRNLDVHQHFDSGGPPSTYLQLVKLLVLGVLVPLCLLLVIVWFALRHGWLKVSRGRQGGDTIK